MLLVVVGLQDVAVLGHHEDGDEVNDSKSQKLSLLTVLLKQTTSTKPPGCVRLPPGVLKLLNVACGRLVVCVPLTISLKTTALRRLMSMSWRSLSKSLTGDIPPVTASTGLCAYENQPSARWHRLLLHPPGGLLIHLHFVELQSKVSQLREDIPPGSMSLT